MHYKYDAVTRKMMRKAMDADTQLQMLKEDITEGRCRNSLHRYPHLFGELAVVDGLVVIGEQLKIPKELWRQAGTDGERVCGDLPAMHGGNNQEGDGTTEAHRATHRT